LSCCDCAAATEHSADWSTRRRTCCRWQAPAVGLWAAAHRGLPGLLLVLVAAAVVE